MFDPLSALSIFAEISVALAGFSGIVIAFGRRSWHDLTPLETRRLSNLFALSGMVLLMSLTGISLLHVGGLALNVVWRNGSAVLFAAGSLWLSLDWLRLRRLAPKEWADINTPVLLLYNVCAAATLLAQLANAVVYAQAWLFFLGLTLAIAFAFQQFILAIRMNHSD